MVDVCNFLKKSPRRVPDGDDFDLGCPFTLVVLVTRR